MVPIFSGLSVVWLAAYKQEGQLQTSSTEVTRRYVENDPPEMSLMASFLEVSSRVTDRKPIIH